MSTSRKLINCPSCGRKVNGKFCSQCGEKIILINYSLKEFFSNALEGFLNFESKFFKSIKLLLSKPGFLTLEFLNGRRVNYMKPFQLFLIINFIMLLSSSILFNENIFSSSYHTHTKAMRYADFANDLTKNEHLKIGLSNEDYERKFNQRLGGYSQTLIFLLIPFFALAIKLLHLKRYYMEHLVNSIHSLSFFLLVFGIFFSPLVALIDLIHFTYWGKHLGDIDNILIPFIFLSLGTYLMLSFRTIYNNSIFASILKSIILIPAFFVLLIGYKFFLFLIVFGSLKIY